MRTVMTLASSGRQKQQRHGQQMKAVRSRKAGSGGIHRGSVLPLECAFELRIHRNMKGSSMSANKPEKVFRIGSVSASIFARTLENSARSLRSVSVQKRYRDGEETKYTNSLSLGDLPNAIRALQLCQSYIEGLEAEIDLPE